MKTILEDEIVSIQGVTNEREFVKSEEYNEIMDALKTLNKHLGAYVVAGYTKGEKMALVYNNTASDNSRSVSSHMGHKLRESSRSEKEVRKNIRGAETASLIMNILIEAEEEYGIPKDVIVQTFNKAFNIMEKLNPESIQKAARRLKEADTIEEGVEITKELLKEAEKPHSGRERLNKKVDGKFSELEELFNDGELAHKLDRHKKNLAPERVLAALGELYGATVVLGIIKVGEDGEPDESESSVQYILQKDLKELSEKSGRDFVGTKISAAGCVAMSVMQQLSDEYGLSNKFWADYIGKNIR